MNKSIPLWRDANTLLLEIEKSVKHFPRYHKYTLGTEMRQQAMRVCRLINRAFIDKETKLQTVKRLVMAINDINYKFSSLKSCRFLETLLSLNTFLSLQCRAVNKVVGGSQIASLCTARSFT